MIGQIKETRRIIEGEPNRGASTHQRAEEKRRHCRRCLPGRRPAAGYFLSSTEAAYQWHRRGLRSALPGSEPVTNRAAGSTPALPNGGRAPI